MSGPSWGGEDGRVPETDLAAFYRERPGRSPGPPSTSTCSLRSTSGSTARIIYCGTEAFEVTGLLERPIAQDGLRHCGSGLVGPVPRVTRSDGLGYLTAAFVSSLANPSYNMKSFWLQMSLCILGGAAFASAPVGAEPAAALASEPTRQEEGINAGSS